MPKPLQQINELISYLPKGDIEHAKRFIKEKDWESLKDLTWSALERIELSYKKPDQYQKYADVDIDKVRDLAVVCSEYYYLIFPEELEDDYVEEED